MTAKISKAEIKAQERREEWDRMCATVDKLKATGDFDEKELYILQWIIRTRDDKSDIKYTRSNLIEGNLLADILNAIKKYEAYIVSNPSYPKLVNIEIETVRLPFWQSGKMRKVDQRSRAPECNAPVLYENKL